MSEALLKLAQALREQAAANEAEKNVKCAQVLQAAIGLTFLRNKLGR